MTKLEFLSALRDKLSGLPKEDIEKSLDYYSEIIDDCVEDGITEDAAVEAIGPIDAIVSDILTDSSLPKLVKAKVVPRRALRLWEIILLILGSPIWLSLLISAASVILSIYIVLWAVVVVLYSVVISFTAGAIAGIFGLISLAVTGNLAQGILLAGIGLICAGLTIFTFYASNQAAKGVAILGKKILLGIKRCFIGKEAA